jgi:D-arabinose 1-dehydrogenase-like Zn-dependent alcohol dehydrogenase
LEFLTLAAQAPIRPRVTPLALGAANEALAQLRNGEVAGALVLVP